MLNFRLKIYWIFPIQIYTTQIMRKSIKIHNICSHNIFYIRNMRLTNVFQLGKNLSSGLLF